MSAPLTVYTPDSSLANPRAMVRAMVADLVRSRGMGWRLAVRDVQAQYRQAFLGLLWAFIGPLATTITWIFLSKSGVVSVGETPLPYPVYVFTGTLLWSILVDAMHSPLQQMATGRAMLAKLNFPREALLLSGAFQLLFNSGIKVVLMVGALLLAGINPGWGLLMFPLGVLSLILVGTSVGLLLTPLGMLYTDVGRAVPLMMSFVMYLTPAVFPMPRQGWVATVYELNPLTPLILTSRAWLTGLTPEFLGYFLVVSSVAGVLLVVAWAAWRLAMPIIIERVSA